MENTDNMEDGLDLLWCWRAIKKRWIIVLILPLIGALIGAGLFYYFSPKPVYLASTTLIMGKPSTLSKSTNNQSDLNDIILGPKLAKIFEPIVKSRNVQQKVIDELDLNLSVEQLDSKISVNSQEESDVIRISVIDGDSKLAAEIANALAEKFSEVVIEVKKVDAVSVLDKAITPSLPLGTSSTKEFLYPIIIGLMAAIGLTLLLEYLDKTLKNSEDIQKILKLPVIGMIPYDKKTTEEIARSLDSDGVWPDSKTKSPFAEAYRSLRTNINFIDFDNANKTILVTSTGPGEGKSVMAFNLAISFIKMGKRVLVIDANLRKPSLHEIFRLTNGQGLSALLTTESTDLRNSVQTGIQGLDRLDVLPSGPVPPNPAELLASDKMKRILADAEAMYDMVIIDSPPTLSIADVAILAQAVDGVIFVVGSREVDQDCALEAKAQLEKVRAKFIGVVLNKIDLKSKNYNLYYKYYEGKGKKLFKRNSKLNSGSQVSI